MSLESQTRNNDKAPSAVVAFILACKDFAFKAVVKLAALRLAVLACLATIATSVLNLDILYSLSAQVYVSTVVFTLFHLIVSTFKTKCIPRIVDVVLLLGEFGLLIYKRHILFFDRFSQTTLIVQCVSGWGLTAVLLYLLLFRVEAIICGVGGVRHTLLEPFSILDKVERGERKGIPVGGCPAACSMLLGRSIWLNRFPGESSAVKLLRGSIAGGFVAALIGYAVVSLVIQPVRETALIPVVESRGKAVPWGGDNRIEDAEWNFVFLRVLPEDGTDALKDPTTFHNAVSVTRLINPSRLNGQAPSSLSCLHSPGALTGGITAVQMIRVYCPSLQVNETGSSITQTLPDIFIMMDFSLLGTSPDSQQYNLSASTPEVFLGLTENTDYLTSSTKPFPLPAGVNYLASVSLDLRKVLRYRALSALGMFEATDAFWMPTVEHVVPDPLTGRAASILPASSNVSSFRLYVPHDPSEIRIVQESREKTILAGMSAIGGLWTLLAGAFGLTFGTKLIQIFLNVKALSIFGLAQHHGREKIVQGYLDEYPKLRVDILADKEDRGMLALLADYMIDFELFRDTSNNTARPVTLKRTSKVEKASQTAD